MTGPAATNGKSTESRASMTNGAAVRKCISGDEGHMAPRHQDEEDARKGAKDAKRSGCWPFIA